MGMHGKQCIFIIRDGFLVLARGREELMSPKCVGNEVIIRSPSSSFDEGLQNDQTSTGRDPEPVQCNDRVSGYEYRTKENSLKEQHGCISFDSVEFLLLLHMT